MTLKPDWAARIFIGIYHGSGKVCKTGSKALSALKKCLPPSWRHEMPEQREP